MTFMEQTGNRRHFPVWLGYVLVLAAFGTPLAGWLTYINCRGWTSSKLERLIQAEIPKGCDRQVVEAWFERHGIPHFFTDHPSGGGKVGKKTVIMLAGLDAKDISGTVMAHLEADHGTSRANLGWGRNGYISIRFFFDKQGRLAGHLVRPFIYSL